jgi:hypothetical protein
MLFQSRSLTTTDSLASQFLLLANMPQYKEPDVVPLQWFNQNQVEGAPISETICVRKAKLFLDVFGLKV